MDRYAAVALRAFTYDTREIQPGEVCQLTLHEALEFATDRRVSLDQTAVNIAARKAALEPPAIPVKTRRTYRRRDLRAEP